MQFAITMLSEQSILRRLPPGLAARELVALDAIRHSADIVGLADVRLRDGLTQIAQHTKASDLEITSCFLDAWSFVDAVDRIRSMARLIAARSSDMKAEVKSFMDVTKAVRELRNVADHLDARVDHVISSNLPAIGRLSWVTVLSTRSALVGVLQPGTVRTNKVSVQLPEISERPVRLPTGAVQLTCGSYSCWFDDVIAAVSHLISQIEMEIDVHVQRHGLHGIEAGRNVLMVGEISFEELPAPVSAEDAQPRLL